MNLCDELTIRMLLERHGFHFSKAMGQNFLIEGWVPRDIADASGADERTGVLEIGPGIGPLTAQLVHRAAKVASVELDVRLYPVLRETMSGADNFTLIEGDAMKLDFPQVIQEHFAGLRPILCANLPYNITTPILTASSPEGARDYLVPARKHPGKFYALPQAPQQFKQLLMTAGFDRYFQIAPCFRDEDARGDRSPGEFYQLDMEMAFATQEDVFAVLEDVLPPIFAKFGTYNVASSAPFRRIAYRDAMETYGSDKPDLRIDLTCKNVTSLFTESEFEALRGQTVKMVPVSDCKLTRKQIDKLLGDCEVQSGSKAYWFKMDENGQLAGGIAKFVTGIQEQLTQALDLKPNTLVLVAAGAAATKSVGVLIKTFGAACENHFDKERYEFCWIVDFPMYEIGDESGQLEFCHNPFSMPSGGLEVLLKAERGEIDPLIITADQYDLVCNGVELSSGAVRNHDPEIMVKAFELVRLGEEDVKKKFPAMYNAFCYGAPPHAGIAPGVDRMVMLLAGESSIREIIPFPMNKNAQDIMMGAPSTVEQKQLDELHIALVGDVEED